MRKKVIGFDIETSGKDPVTCKVASIQLYEDGEARIIPIDLRGAPAVDPGPIFRDIAARYRVIGHFLSFDLTVAQRYGAIIEPAADTYILFQQCPDALVQPRDKRGLKDLVQFYGIDQDPLRYEDVCPTGDFRDVSVEDREAMIYAGADPQYAFMLARLLIEKYPYLEQSHLDEMSVLNVFAGMSLRGLTMSPEGLANLKSNLELELNQARLELFEYVGAEFKPNSAKDLMEKEVFERLSLTPPEKGPKKYPSITKEVLEGYLPNQGICQLLRVRQLMYALPRVENVLFNHVKNGKLHPTYLQVGYTGSARVYTQGPSTGSLSASARACVVAPSGCKFVYMDWSGAEFALAIQEAGEIGLVKGYLAGQHPIVAAAAQTFGVDPSQVTEKQKEIMKTVVYAVLYGSGGYSVAQALGVSLEKAQEYIDGFWSKAPRLSAFRDQVIEEAEITGTVTTLTGFTRTLRDPVTGDVRGDLERRAFNTRCQSGVAGLFKIALRKLSETMPSDWKIVTGVFDSMLVSVPDGTPFSEVRNMLDRVSIFTEEDGLVPGLTVIFNTKVGEGHTWASAQKRAI